MLYRINRQNLMLNLRAKLTFDNKLQYVIRHSDMVPVQEVSVWIPNQGYSYTLYHIHYKRCLYEYQIRGIPTPCTIYTTRGVCMNTKSGVFLHPVPYTLQEVSVWIPNQGYSYTLYHIHYKRCLYEYQIRGIPTPCTIYTTRGVCMNTNSGVFLHPVPYTLQEVSVWIPNQGYSYTLYHIHYMK